MSENESAIPTILQTIAKSVLLKLEARKHLISFSALEESIRGIPARLPFRDGFLRPGTDIIAEIKFRSPALGVLERASIEDAVKIAGTYLAAGATAILVLTEEEYFHGSADFLKAVRKVYPTARLLMKDFVIDEYQLLEARAMGADAALLIVALLGKNRTEELLNFSRNLGLSTLVEVHDEAELAIALSIGSDLIGVNNRNLKTLEISLETSVRLAPLIPKESLVLSESGIRTREEIVKLQELGYQGFLIGGSLMTASDPGLELKKLIGSVP